MFLLPKLNFVGWNLSFKKRRDRIPSSRDVSVMRHPRECNAAIALRQLCWLITRKQVDGFLWNFRGFYFRLSLKNVQKEFV